MRLALGKEVSAISTALGAAVIDVGPEGWMSTSHARHTKCAKRDRRAAAFKERG